MVELRDLSVPLDEGTQVYPGDPPFAASPATSLTVDGFNVGERLGQWGAYCLARPESVDVDVRSTIRGLAAVVSRRSTQPRRQPSSFTRAA